MPKLFNYYAKLQIRYGCLCGPKIIDMREMKWVLTAG